MLNYYQVLEIPDFSPEQNIKRAFRAKCRQYHPDLVNTLGPKLSSLAEHEMAIINKAYEILGDPKKRIVYNTWLRTAGQRDILKPCRVCGIRYEPKEEEELNGICPYCEKSSSKPGWEASEEEVEPASAAELLKTCFVVIHHFVSSMSLHKFIPILSLMVSGERMEISCPPGPMEVTLYNKEIYDLIQSDNRITKSPWSYIHKLGKITFAQAHPVKSAATFWMFCNLSLGEPELDFCTIEIDDEDYKSYEHVLNQSVIIALAKLSPWNASKLFARHQKNLIAAVNDPEAKILDPFFNVILKQPIDKAGHEDQGLEQENRKLQAELLSAKSELATKNKSLLEEKILAAKLRIELEATGKIAAGFRDRSACLTPDSEDENQQTSGLPAAVKKMADEIKLLRSEARRLPSNKNPGHGADVISLAGVENR